MSTFRAFQTGLAAGQEQRKYRDENDARTQAAEAFKSGNFEGAVAPLMRVGLMQEADAYGQAGQRKQETERTQTYMEAYKTGLGAGPAPNKRGAYEAVGSAAMEAGDFDMMATVDQAIAGMDEQQKAQLTESMEFLGQTALNLKSVPPEARGQAAMEILQGSPLANPQIMQQIQQAAADGKITDEELDNFAMQTMSVAERVKFNQQNAPKPPEPFTLSPGQTRYGPDGKPLVSVPDRAPRGGITMTTDENGNPVVTIGGPQLPVGGSGTRGNEPSVGRGPDGTPVVTPGAQQLQLNKSYNALQDYEAQNAIIIQDIDRALSRADFFTTGLFGAAFQGIPGTPQHDLWNTLNTIKSNIGFGKLQEMRENSPTGGALGSVTERENQLLQSVLGALEQSQSEGQFRQNMIRLKDILADKEGRRKQAFARDYPDLATFAGFVADTGKEIKRIQSAADYNALQPGEQYYDDQGNLRTKR